MEGRAARVEMRIGVQEMVGVGVEILLLLIGASKAPLVNSALAIGENFDKDYDKCMGLLKFDQKSKNFFF